MAKASDNDFPSLLLSEQGSKPTAPAANKQRLYMKTDHKLYHEDSGGTETEVGGSGFAQGCAIYHSTTQNIANGSDTALTFDSEEYDGDSMHEGVTNPTRITINTAGKYALAGTVCFAYNNSNERGVAIRKNGGLLLGFVRVQAITTNSNVVALAVSAIADLVGTDYLELIAYQDILGGGTLATYSAATFRTRFSAHRIG